MACRSHECTHMSRVMRQDHSTPHASSHASRPPRDMTAKALPSLVSHDALMTAPCHYLLVQYLLVFHSTAKALPFRVSHDSDMTWQRRRALVEATRDLVMLHV